MAKRKDKMGRQQAILFVSLALMLGLILGALWHKLYLFPFPQLSHLLRNNLPGFRLPTETDYFTLDSIAGHIHKTHSTREYIWQEHPKGIVRMTANNLGFREDSDTAIQKAFQTYRVLVTGDSHMDGFVYNSESFANRLESLLNSQSKKRKFEVLNGGTGLYGPYNYSGFLRKFLYLKPDMYVVVLYTGNDFIDGLKTATIRKSVHIDKRPEGYKTKLKKAWSEKDAAVWQALNQIYFFKTYPAMTAIAVDIAVAQMVEIQKICSIDGIELLVLTLPTIIDVGGDSIRGTWDNAREILGLSLEDLKNNKSMGQQFLAILDKLGIETLDLLPAMQCTEQELFWEKDYHLNHRGHDLVARVFFEHFGAKMSGGQRPTKHVKPKNGIHSNGDSTADNVWR